MSLDRIEYTILTIVSQSEEPMWKNRIHREITDNNDRYPINAVSVQTVGRRVDGLRDRGLLESCIISPEDIKRDLIIAFKATEDGLDAKQEKSDKLLKTVVKSQIFDEIDCDLSESAVKHTVATRFNIGALAQEQLQNEYDVPELATILTLYYAKRRVTDNFDSDSVEKFVSLIEQSDEMHETFRTRVLKGVHA